MDRRAHQHTGTVVPARRFSLPATTTASFASSPGQRVRPSTVRWPRRTAGSEATGVQLAGNGRGNTELVAATWQAAGRHLAVPDDGEVDDDLVRDMVEVPTSCRARWSGRRSAKHRARTALEAALEAAQHG